MPISVMPIWTVLKNFVGSSASSRAAFAPLLPFLARDSSLLRRAETMDISAVLNSPLSKMRPKMMSSSCTIAVA